MATFTVAAADDLTVDCPADPCCRYAAPPTSSPPTMTGWGASATWGCDATRQHRQTCQPWETSGGGQLSFTYAATSGPRRMPGHGFLQRYLHRSDRRRFDGGLPGRTPCCRYAASCRHPRRLQRLGERVFFSWAAAAQPTTSPACRPRRPHLRRAAQLYYTASFRTRRMPGHGFLHATFTVGGADDLTVRCATDPCCRPAAAPPTSSPPTTTGWRLWLTDGRRERQYRQHCLYPGRPHLTAGQISFTLHGYLRAGRLPGYGFLHGYFPVGADGLTVDCPADPMLPGMQQRRRHPPPTTTGWRGFFYMGGCDVTDNIASVPPWGDLTCGGQQQPHRYLRDDGCRDMASCAMATPSP